MGDRDEFMTGKDAVTIYALSGQKYTSARTAEKVIILCIGARSLAGMMMMIMKRIYF